MFDGLVKRVNVGMIAVRRYCIYILLMLMYLLTMACFMIIHDSNQGKDVSDCVIPE